MLPVPAQPPEPTISSLREAPGASGEEADGGALGPYWTFYWAVAAAQLARWLPRNPARVLDLSGGGGRFARQAARSGHTVLEVLDHPPEALTPEAPASGTPARAVSASEVPASEVPAPAAPADDHPAGGHASDARAANGVRGGGRTLANGRTLNGIAPGPRRPAGLPRIPGLGPTHPALPPGEVRRVVGDPGAAAFLADACVDAVIAENRMLSRHLVAESTVAEIARVLRPGGRVLLTVDSLTLGMALLAEQNCWAHLSDVPRAEVVLVPWPDGTITRCFQSDELRELLTDAGLEVEWIRPRTALSASTVEHVMATSPGALPRLVRTELNVPPGDESLGIHLLASAVRV
ncbi:methyltransferase domain-containing protein [Spirillospora sp. NPDC052269]